MFVLFGSIPSYLLKPLDTVYSARANSHKFWSLRTQCVCVLCLVVETNVIHFIYPRLSVFSVRYELALLNNTDVSFYLHVLLFAVAL